MPIFIIMFFYFKSFDDNFDAIINADIVANASIDFGDIIDDNITASVIAIINATFNAIHDDS